MNPLTIAYVTNRKNPRIEWFFDSLAKQLKDPANAILEPQVVVVSFHADLELPKKLPVPAYRFRFLTPKPNVWNGPHRLTQANWFAAANSRNTALCVADSPWIAYVDDLSVLRPGWLDAVRMAIAAGVITFGSYKKVKRLQVEDGLVKSCEEFKEGVDSRWHHGSDVPVPASGSWLFGCSLVAPVDALLAVNGWDENCDGLGGEDYCLGIRLQNHGFSFRYDRSMCTFESEEAHFEEPPFRKTDKGVSPLDKSHAALKMAKESAWAPNYFGEGGIRALREHVLGGKPFPVQQIPDRDWYDGQLLSEML